MNIIEAIKSGKRFKRKSWESWLTTEKEKNVSEYRFDLPLEAIIADDWEVEPDAVTITRKQFDAAWDKGLEAHRLSIELHAILCKELGL